MEKWRRPSADATRRLRLRGFASMELDLLACVGLKLGLQVLHVTGIAGDVQQLFDDGEKEMEGPDPRQGITPPKGPSRHGHHHGAQNHAERNAPTEEGPGALPVVPRGDRRCPG
jgi:hypothetical protein